MPEVALERAAAIGWIITRDSSRVMAHPECLVHRFVASAKLRISKVGLRKCIWHLLEWITPGQDGMSCAVFPINY